MGAATVSSMLNGLEGRGRDVRIGDPSPLDIARGNHQGKGGPDARRARHRQLAAEQLGELARERQPEPRTGGSLLESALELGELLEDAILVFRRNADAGVG